MAPRDRGRRGRDAYGGRGGRSGEDKNKDTKKDKKSEKKDTKKTTDSPGPIGGAGSYGMDRETFDRTIGSGRERGGDSKQEKGVWDSITDFVQEKVTDVRDYFTGTEDVGGFSPMGGPSSYGMSKKDFDTSIGKRRHDARSLDERMMREIDYFREAPMDYAADLLRNPLVAGAAAMSGLGMTAFGITAVDAVMDMVQNEATTTQAVTNTLRAAIDYTPVGVALGPVKGVAKAALDSPEAAIEAGGGVIGTQVAGRVGMNLAGAITDNPMARAAITAGTAAAGGLAGRKALAGKAVGTGNISGMSPGRKGEGKKTSPLVSSGEAAVEAHSKLAQQSQQPVDLYAQTVQQLPYYGLQYQQPTKLPYYGV